MPKISLEMNWGNILPEGIVVAGAMIFHLKDYGRNMHRKCIIGWLLLSGTDTLKENKETEGC